MAKKNPPISTRKKGNREKIRQFKAGKEGQRASKIRASHKALRDAKTKKLGDTKSKVKPGRLIKSTQGEIYKGIFPFLNESKLLTYNQKKFLNAFCHTGNLTAAADICNLSVASHYRWTDASPNKDEYNLAFQQAKETALEAMEFEARRRAMDGSDLLMMFLLKSWKPTVYREERNATKTVKHEGKIEHAHKVNPDEIDISKLPLNLRQQLLEVLMTDPDLSQPDNVPVPVEALENANLVEVTDLTPNPLVSVQK